MKKLNTLFTLVLFSLFFISCGNLFESKKNTTEKDYNLTLNLRNGGTGNSSRTISSVSGWNVSDLTWTVEFYNSSNAKITPVATSEDGKSFKLSSGNYTVKVSAAYEGHTIYGEKEVSIVDGETTSVSIAVGLKKTATGTGSIGEISVDLSDALSKISPSAGNNAKLVPVKSDEATIELSVALDSSKSTAVLTKSGTIPSGYYYLQIEMPGIDGSKDVVNLILNDSLVEIADGETINASLKALDADAYGNYYASYVGSGNGVTPSNRISYGNLLTALKNKGSTRYVNIYFDDNLAFDLDELSEIPAASEDDYVNFIITTNYYTYQIIYSCYRKTLNYAEGNVHLRVNNGNVKDLYVESSSYGNLSTLDLHNKATVGLFDYSNSEDNPIYFICDHSADNHGTLSCNATLADYYKGTGVPFLTNVVNSTEPLAIDVDDINCEVVYTVEDAPAEYDLPGGKLYSYYLVPTGSTGVSFSTVIPEFEIIEINKRLISGKDYEFYAMNLSFAATPKTGNFLNNTSFIWKLNDHVITSAGSSEGNLIIDTSSTDVYLNVSGSNILVCEATYDDGNKKAYKSATFELNYTNPVAEGMVWVAGTTIKGTETWPTVSNIFVSGRKLLIPDLFVSDHEVTRGEYKAVMGNDPSSSITAYNADGTKLTGDDLLYAPVSGVNWYDAIVYCNKASIQEGFVPCYSISGKTNPDEWGDVPSTSNTENKAAWDAVTCDFNANGYRLPTEAEWEWLARGGEEYKYAGSNNINDVAWYSDNTGYSNARKIKTKMANGYDLYDMSGNVSEWCFDWNGTINASSLSYGAVSGTKRVIRGGDSVGDAPYCECSDRSNDYYNPTERIGNIGFRVVRTDTSSKNNGFVLISAGTFMMGTNVVGGNGPAHEVKLTRDYYMCDHEVTQAEYEEIMGVNPSMNKHMEGWPNFEVAEGEIQENRPVDGVSWIMAVTYCNKRSIAEGLTPVYSLIIDGTRTTDPTNWRINGLSTFYDDEKDGTYPGFESWLTVEQNLDANGYRLPTEAEWEYAARAGDNTVDSYIYAGTNNFDEINDYAWLGYWIDEANHKCEGRSHEVKKKKPNAWGLYDMLGNVTEYCWDWWEGDSKGNYTGTDGVTVDPCENGNRDNYYYRGSGDYEEPSMCVRGGTVGNPENNSETMAALTYRESYPFYVGSNEKGFRVVRTFTD